MYSLKEKFKSVLISHLKERVIKPIDDLGGQKQVFNRLEDLKSTSPLNPDEKIEKRLLKVLKIDSDIAALISRLLN